MNKVFYTYLHCTPNGTPFYVGKGHGNRSRIFNKRTNDHAKIVEEYGKDNIQVFTFICDSESQAFQDEIQQIAQLRELGYQLVNISKGGKGSTGWKPNALQKKKQSDSLKGMQFTEERCKNISKSLTGKKFSEERKIRLSIAHLGNKPSSLTKENMSIAQLKRWSSIENHNAQQVKCIETGYIFKNSIEAAAWLGNSVHKSTIHGACSGRRKTAYKFHWEYV